MRFVDTHCHLDFEVFAESRVALFQQCVEAGICDVVIPATTASSLHSFEQLAEELSSSEVSNLTLHFAAGLHPYFSSVHRDEDLGVLRQLFAERKFSVLGEIGLDARLPDMMRQRFFFDAQLEMAHEFGVPVIVHSVKAHAELLQRLKHYAVRAGVVHAFSGSLQEALGFVEQGLKIGVGGVITWPRAQKTRATIASLPLESLVLETDAPDMPVLGKAKGEGSPLDVLTVFEILCELRSESPERIWRALYENSQFLLSADFINH